MIKNIDNRVWALYNMETGSIFVLACFNDRWEVSRMVTFVPKMLPLLVGGLISVSCSGGFGDKMPPIQVLPKGSSFEVIVGQEVEWRFVAKRGRREISIIDVASPRPPFGVKPVYEPGKFGFKGKILGRQFRGGLIQVTAFDKEACEQSYADMKKMVEKNMREARSSEATVPLEPCKPGSAISDPSMSEFVSRAHFYWHMSDAPDELKPEDYRQVAEALSCEAAGACASDEQFFAPDPSKLATTKKTKKPSAAKIFVVIPRNEAPAAVDVVLGECARFERKECGKEKECAWGRGSCVTASTLVNKQKTGERQ